MEPNLVLGENKVALLGRAERSMVRAMWCKVGGQEGYRGVDGHVRTEGSSR